MKAALPSKLVQTAMHTTCPGRYQVQISNGTQIILSFVSLAFIHPNSRAVPWPGRNHFYHSPIIRSFHAAKSRTKKSDSRAHKCSFIKIYKLKGGYTLVMLPCIVTSYRDYVDGTRDRVMYQKLVTARADVDVQCHVAHPHLLRP
jgi:hypothetical protein